MVLWRCADWSEVMRCTSWVGRSVVMGGTMGTGTFKPEKNLVFFQDKKSRSP